MPVCDVRILVILKFVKLKVTKSLMRSTNSWNITGTIVGNLYRQPHLSVNELRMHYPLTQTEDYTLIVS